MSDFFKTYIRNYLIVLAVLIAGGALLVTVELLVQPVRQKKLQQSVLTVLAQTEETEFTAGHTVPIALPLAISAYAVTVTEKDTKPAAHNAEKTAVLVQISGLCGPVPAVFIYDKDTGCRFSGIAGIKEAAVPEKFGIDRSLAEYWQQVLEPILAGSDAKESA